LEAKEINQDKVDALNNTIKTIEKQFGKGSIMKLGENSTMNVAVVSTGCISLDMALGVGGLPRGRVVEIFGPESSGKTTVALHSIAQAQKEGGMAAFVDAEHALDPLYARRLGVDINNLLVLQPDNGEQALEIVRRWYEAAPSTSLSSIRSLHWFPKPKSKGKWGIVMLVCKPGLCPRLCAS
jgi:recombination protein RecA